jgi:hypothetical protein
VRFGRLRRRQGQRDRALEILVTAMTRYSRSVIPGRSSGDASNPAELDRLVFGQKGRMPAAANDEEDDGPAINDLHIERGPDRRKGPRRKSEYAPLPQDGKKFRSSDEGSKRGPLLLFGALIIVGVFGVVVWNAYRDGVRPQDSNTAPLLETSGAFKSKPEVVTPTTAEQASVFEQVEAPARPAVDPAPEVRPEPAAPAQAAAPPPPKPAVAAPAPAKPAETKSAAAAPAPAKPAASKPAEIKPAPAATAPAAPVATTPSPKVEAPISLTPKSPVPGDYAPAFASDGKFAVQVAAASTEAGAIAEWNKHAKRSPELFSAAERFVVQADVNGRTVYRLRAGSFASAADADAFCGAFKAKGGQCFRVGK